MATTFSLMSILKKMIWNYAYLNKGLVITYNGKKYVSRNGLFDLLENNIDSEIIYPIIHIREENFEFAFTHSDKAYGRSTIRLLMDNIPLKEELINKRSSNKSV